MLLHIQRLQSAMLNLYAEDHPVKISLLSMKKSLQ